MLKLGRLCDELKTPLSKGRQKMPTLTVSTLAALRALPPPAPPPADDTSVVVERCNSDGDGGGGTFYWDASSTAEDDGGTIIAPIPPAGNGRWQRIFEGPVNVKWWCAYGDYHTAKHDDTKAIQAAL